jgi:hypothetical protein
MTGGLCIPASTMAAPGAVAVLMFMACRVFALRSAPDVAKLATDGPKRPPQITTSKRI